MQTDTAPRVVTDRLRRPPRDTRLDIVRGWLQLTIMASHVGGFASIWLIHAAWGYSDSSEQFVLLSGLMLGSVFTLKRLRDGWMPALRDMTTRVVRLWRARLVTLLGFGGMLIALDLTVMPGEASPYHFDFLMQQPVRATLTAALMLYNPAYIDVLVVFILSMAALPAFIFAVERAGAWALALPAALWGAVQIWHLPSPDLAPDSPTAFNVLAWQSLFMLGAYFGRRKLLTGQALPTGAWVTWLSGGIVALGLAMRIIDYTHLNIGVAMPEVNGFDKLELSPLRLGHALALAIFVARITPVHAKWMEVWPANVMASLGRHSLNVYCLGIFLSFGAARVLALAGPDHPWVEAPLILAGFAMLGLYARWQDGFRFRLLPLVPSVPARGETR